MRFVLNFKEVFGSTNQARGSATLEEILLGVLRPCARSLAFRFSFDTQRLLDFVENADELVYLSVQSEMPRSREAPRARVLRFLSDETSQPSFKTRETPNFLPCVNAKMLLRIALPPRVKTLWG